MPCVTCHLSRVTCHLSHDFNFNFVYKLLKLVGGGSVIDRAYPVYFFSIFRMEQGVYLTANLQPPSFNCLGKGAFPKFRGKIMSESVNEIL